MGMKKTQSAIVTTPPIGNLVGGRQSTISNIPPVPSLPPTTLAETKAPGGIPPVRPATKAAAASDSEKMTKADWSRKDRTIELQAIMKSTLESPAVAQLVVGKRLDESLQTLKTVFEFCVDLYDSKK